MATEAEMTALRRLISRRASTYPECKKDDLFDEALNHINFHIREDMAEPGNIMIARLGLVSNMYAVRALRNLGTLPNLEGVSRSDAWLAFEFAFVDVISSMRWGLSTFCGSKFNLLRACEILFIGSLANRQDMIRVSSRAILDPRFSQQAADDWSPERRKVADFAGALARSGGVEVGLFPGLESFEEVMRVHLSVAKAFKDSLYFYDIFGSLPVFAAVALPRGSHALLDQTRDLIADLTPVENDLLREVQDFLPKGLRQ